jgi:DNA recombination protein RmuC
MIALAFFIFKKRENAPEQNQIFLMLQNQISDLRQAIDSKLSESSALTKTQLGESAKIVREVTAQLTKIDETNRQVVNFADQLQDLQDILKNPKQRGVLGEYYLETVLKNVLPPKSYQMQYALGEDESGKKMIVDAVVFVKEKIIPVD